MRYTFNLHWSKLLSVFFKGSFVLSMKKYLILLFIVAASWSFYKQSRPVMLGPGVMVAELPQQEEFASAILNSEEYLINGVAKFHIKAKVLAKKNYSVDREAGVSPTDLALGWGKMSDEGILQEISISQSNRFYWWSVKEFPIPREEIETHSANMHLIPANDSVKRVIAKIRQGEIIELTGNLVNVKSKRNGWLWSSSLTRNDTGTGACEIVWVESASIVTP